MRFAAQDVRKEKTGTHAKIAISMNWVSLGWTNFNIERDEDRVRLANSAYAHLDGEAHALDKVEMPKNSFKHALDLFCEGLWDEVVGLEIGGLMEGDPNRPPAKRILGDYILDEAGTILFAPPGKGKSNTALAWAVSMMWGKDKVWPIHNAAVPLYINVERSGPSMAGRLARINRCLGLEPETPIPFLNARGRSISDIYEAAKRTIKKEGCTVVFYDSVSRMGQGSLVADDVANKAMDMLNALSPSWVALAHSPRGDESHVFGSQMFDAAADLTVQLQSQASFDGYTTGVSLEVAKANDIRKPPIAVHAFEWDEEGLVDIRKARQGEFGELEASQRMGLEQTVAELLKGRGAMSATDIADELGRNRSNVALLLSKGDRFVQTGRDGKAVLYGLRA